ncbi:hypothetical protein AVEN_132790-1 [Araneus ventricosus]|uniref:Uncharacterized protein n=1 Tax=Araneus ventricosus TaxID=182803 RepID=A0A4Y2URV5_ARAVE|nr:hypothetical protein AVEN_132790-1 [Araneus ventricosus]
MFHRFPSQRDIIIWRNNGAAMERNPCLCCLLIRARPIRYSIGTSKAVRNRAFAGPSNNLFGRIIALWLQDIESVRFPINNFGRSDWIIPSDNIKCATQMLMPRSI